MTRHIGVWGYATGFSVVVFGKGFSVGPNWAGRKRLRNWWWPITFFSIRGYEGLR
jgi:hypothetical protein